MTFEKAKQELAKLADGKYYSISYGFTRFSSDIEEVECGVYIDGFNWFVGSKWEVALDMIKRELGVSQKVDNNEQPLIDDIDTDDFCNKYTPDIGDWLEENYPDDIINRAERIENERNAERIEMMSAKELKADRLEYESNVKGE